MDANDEQEPVPPAVDALWREIEQRLPACIRENPKTPGRIGFLLGLGAGHFASRILRRLIGGDGQ